MVKRRWQASQERGAWLQVLFGLVTLVVVFGTSSENLHAQGAGASMQGTVRDVSQAVIPGASVTVINVETGLQRSVTTNNAGAYSFPNLPPGRYSLEVSLTGFQTYIRTDIHLVVGQQAVVDSTLQVGEVTERITVTGEAAMVATSVADVSGLVGEQEVKELPLSGRSFDNLVSLNPATVNTTALIGATSGSSGPGNYFSIGGRRPGTNKFLWNGIEYPGSTTAQSGSPGGASGQLLGVDAVREFNMAPNIESAEYGHRIGGQINVVTASGTNTFHGTLFHFLRNDKLDARNFFDPGGVPPFKRNQFGAAAGGPIRRDKSFIFGNYEGFRERLGATVVAIVPDAEARRGLVPNTQGVYQAVPNLKPAVLPFFAMWPEPSQPILLDGKPTGTAKSVTHPSQPIRQDFGIVRVDHTFSDRDTMGGSYTVDDAEAIFPQTNPFTRIELITRAQLASLTETHIFGPSVVNRFTVGFSRVRLANPAPTLDPLPPGVVPFVEGHILGRIAVGGGTGGGATGLAFIGNGPNVSDTDRWAERYTLDNQVYITRGLHSISTGFWFNRLLEQHDSLTYDRASFDDMTAFLQGRPASVQVVGMESPQSPDNWRMNMGAWYVQDTIRLTSNFTLSAGVRHEFTDGWNSGTGTAVLNILNGILMEKAELAKSIYRENNARWLFGPRLGIAWDPFGDGKTSIRSGFGIAYGLLDSMHQCCSSHPFGGGQQLTNFPFPLALKVGQPIPAGIGATSSQPGGGVQEDAKTPALINYRLEIERGLDDRTTFRAAYTGSKGYHDLLRSDMNQNIHVICSAVQRNCPASVADGAMYFPTPVRRYVPSRGSFTAQFTDAINRYNSFVFDLNRRFGSGYAIRTNYTYARSLDNQSSLSSPQAIGNVPVLQDYFDRRMDYGLSAFDVRKRFSISGMWELPFGPGRAFASRATGVADKLVSGWRLTTIISLQDGFPLTPRLGFNQSRNGNTGNPDRPSMAPGRTLRDDNFYLGTPERWFDPRAFAVPLAGTYGDVGRNVIIGPGIVSVDLSAHKEFRFTERVNLSFRAEAFNIINRANFGLPQPLVLERSGAPRGAAGVIDRTTTKSRQLQFALKLNW